MFFELIKDFQDKDLTGKSAFKMMEMVRCYMEI